MQPYSFVQALVRMINLEDQYGSMRDVAKDGEWHPSISQSREVQDDVVTTAVVSATGGVEAGRIDNSSASLVLDGMG